MVYAFSTSIFFAVVGVTPITYCSTVISRKPFLMDFTELLGIMFMFAVTVVPYLFGYLAGVTTSIRAIGG